MTFLPWIAKERSMDDILTLDSKGEIHGRHSYLGWRRRDPWTTFLHWIAKERSMHDILTLDSKGEIHGRHSYLG